MKAIFKKITPFISFLFFGLAVWFLSNQLGSYSIQQMVAYMGQIPAGWILVSLVLSFLSYLLLTVYDALGVTYIGKQLSYSKTAQAGFIGYAFSHNMGMALITGGSIRYRLYSSWGFTGLQVTQIVAFSALTLWIGFCAVGGAALLLVPPTMLSNTVVTFLPLKVVGTLLLLMVAGYLLFSGRSRRTFSILKWNFTVPAFRMALKQVAVASVDWLLAASVLYVLLPTEKIFFFTFVGVFLIAQIIGLTSQVPGGLGVFESVMLLYLTNFLPGSSIIGILLVYRVIYYLIPLLVAMVLLAYQEYQANRRAVKRFGMRTARWFPRAVPYLFSTTIFIGGAVLLFSGALPAEIPHMEWLQLLIPLPVISMSHFLASLVGAALLVLAHGLQYRIDAAYHTTLALLIFGILFSVLTGQGYGEAIMLGVMMAALIPSRKVFHRKASLFTQSYSPTWIAMILTVVFSSMLLGFFSYLHMEYQQELWWQFMLWGDAPTYVRMWVALLGLAFLYALINLFKPQPKTVLQDDEQQFETARSIVKNSSRAQANLLLLGDKKLLLNEEKDACIMYGVADQSWIAMGDPLGEADKVKKLAWRFKELCEQNRKWAVFYQVQSKYLDLYDDLGLNLLKLGEQARLSLDGFNIRAAIHPALAEHYYQATKNGYQFEVIPAGRTSRYFSRLKEVSEAWLKEGDNHEKSFSLGYYDETYLQHFPIATIQRKGEIVAFSNIWVGGNRYEIACDLIRLRPGVMPYVRDFLQTEIALWGKRQGYHWFNLGLAPLSEMNTEELEPQWADFARQLYQYDEHLYNFKGLRKQKERFNPRWESLYLASPGGLAIPSVLSNLSAKISGQIKREQS